jgi:hypothetical protein
MMNKKNLTTRINETRRRIRELETQIRTLEAQLHTLKMQLVENTTARGNSNNLFASNVERYLFNMSSPRSNVQVSRTTKSLSKNINMGRLAPSSSSSGSSSATSKKKKPRRSILTLPGFREHLANKKN